MPQNIAPPPPDQSNQPFSDLSIPDVCSPSVTSYLHSLTFFKASTFDLDFSTLHNPDILENFDFDTFLNTDADTGFGFDPNIYPTDGVEAGDSL